MPRPTLRDVTPNRLPMEQLLALLISDAAAIITAATACLQQGWAHDHPIYGANSEQLAKAIGDAEGIVAELPLDGRLRSHFRSTRMDRARGR